MIGGVSGGDGGEPSATGRMLERTRRERGLALEEVERATGIRAGVLNGLEREDSGALPDAVYVPILLRRYADYLGLDGEKLARELRPRLAGRAGRAPSSPGKPEGAIPDSPLISIARTAVAAFVQMSLAILILAAAILALSLLY